MTWNKIIEEIGKIRKFVIIVNNDESKEGSKKLKVHDYSKENGKSFVL